jgi:hypothetical protein
MPGNLFQVDKKVPASLALQDIPILDEKTCDTHFVIIINDTSI